MLPGLYHELVLEKRSKSLWIALDRKVRAAVRRWVHLPHDVPQPLFHAHTDQGGLGIPELLVQVPLMRRARVEKLFGCATMDHDQVLAAVAGMSKDLRKERELWKDGVQCYSQQVTSRASRERATASALHVSCDGAGLADTCEVPAVSRWVTSGSGLVSGKSFVDVCTRRSAPLGAGTRSLGILG